MKRNTIALFLIILFFFICDDVWSQQEAQFSHNMFNNMAINPGYAGMNSAICALALARQQWVGYNDVENNALNPETYSFTVDAPFRFLKGGLALGFLQDQLGYETALGVKLAYSYHLPMTYGTMGLGLQVGFLDKRLDFSGLKPLNEGDPVISGGSSEESRMFTDLAIGAYYKSDNNAFAGVSISQVFQPQREIANAKYKLRRHMYFTAGYHYTLKSNPAFVLSPSALFKTDFSSIQADLTAMLTYRERFWGGLSYRIQDATVILLGLTFEQISIGYSYDITLSPLGRNARSWGSHEIMVRYCFSLDIEKIQQTQRNVRFL